MSWFEAIVVATGILGAFVTYWIQHRFKISATQASAGLSFIVALTAYLISDVAPQEYRFICPAVFFGASFVGMSSKNILPKLWQVACAGALFSIIFLNTSTYFEGFGGALGTTACIAVVLTFGINMLLKLKLVK